MDNVFAKPPSTVPQHYKALLQKKEATLAASTDCFAPASSAPAHLYTSKGIMMGLRKGNSVSQHLSQSNPTNSVLNSDPGKSVNSSEQPSKESSLRLQLEEQRVLNAKLGSRVQYLEALLKQHGVTFKHN